MNHAESKKRPYYIGPETNDENCKKILNKYTDKVMRGAIINGKKESN